MEGIQLVHTGQRVMEGREPGKQLRGRTGRTPSSGRSLGEKVIISSFGICSKQKGQALEEKAASMVSHLTPLLCSPSVLKRVKRLTLRTSEMC